MAPVGAPGVSDETFVSVRGRPTGWREGRRTLLMLGTVLALGLLHVATRMDLHAGSKDARWIDFQPREQVPIELLMARPITEQEQMLLQSASKGEESAEDQAAPEFEAEFDHVFTNGTAELAGEGLGEGEDVSTARGALDGIAEVKRMDVAHTPRMDASRMSTRLVDMKARSIEHLGVDEMPLLEEIEVRYPKNARSWGVEGRVILAFLVDVDGRAYDIEILESEHPMLNPAAINGIRNATFIPGKLKGNHVPSRMKLAVRFTFV